MSDSSGRKQRERDQRRRDILRAALTLFSQKGYEGTSMAEIAAASEFAVGTLYKFFEDKRALYQALVAETTLLYEERLTEALRGSGDEFARIERFITVAGEMFVEHLPMAKVYFSQTAAAFLFSSIGLEDDAYVSYQRIMRALADTFRSGVESGKFVSMEPMALAMGLEGILGSFLGALVRQPGCYTPAQIADMSRRMFFDAVAAGALVGHE